MDATAGRPLRRVFEVETEDDLGWLLIGVAKLERRKGVASWVLHRLWELP